MKSISVSNSISRKSVYNIIKKNWQLYLMLSLPIVFYLIFMYGPIFGNIIAFRKYYPGGSVLGSDWVGLKYFKLFFFDAEFWQVFKNTALLSFLNLLFGFPFPIIFALLLNELKGSIFKRIVQTTSYLPHFLSSVIIVGIVTEMLAPRTGIINKIIIMFGGQSISFLQEPEWFRTIYIVSDVWQSMGWNAIIYLAALSTIDPELYEAAEIDGANRWKQTIHITLAGLVPTIVIILVLAVGKMIYLGFEKILLLYNPTIYETADVISTYVYRIGLENSNYSYATAIGIFESIIALFLILSANILSRKLSETSLW